VLTWEIPQRAKRACHCISLGTTSAACTRAFIIAGYSGNGVWNCRFSLECVRVDLVERRQKMMSANFSKIYRFGSQKSVSQFPANLGSRNVKRAIHKVNVLQNEGASVIHNVSIAEHNVLKLKPI
jgi:hypothetical protein